MGDEHKVYITNTTTGKAEVSTITDYEKKLQGGISEAYESFRRILFICERAERFGVDKEDIEEIMTEAKKYTHTPWLVEIIVPSYRRNEK